MNMHGYSDYNGPGEPVISLLEDSENNTWTVGHWMEGDSLAPPCGSSLSVSHSIIDSAFNFRREYSQAIFKDQPEVFYDLGCGDGRLCLEAYWKYCIHGTEHDLVCVGVEIEDDLIQRFQYLRDKMLRQVCRENMSGQVIPVKGDLCDVLKSLQQSCSVMKEIPSTYSNLPKPTMITMYLLPEAMQLLEPALLELLKLVPNLIIICNTWGLKQRFATRIINAIDEETGLEAKLYLYANEEIITDNK